MTENINNDEIPDGVYFIVEFDGEKSDVIEKTYKIMAYIQMNLRLNRKWHYINNRHVYIWYKKIQNEDKEY